VVLYADDTNLNRTFGGINTWFNANLLTLNFQKTQYMEFRLVMVIKVQR
jgi:hypothetical protein